MYRYKLNRLKVARLTLVILLLISLLPFSFAASFTKQDPNIESPFRFTSEVISTSKYNYPFSESYDSTKDIKIKQVGLDILYGNNKKLMYYTGEVPYLITRDILNDLNAKPGFAYYPYNALTQVDYSSESYWGKISDKIDVNNVTVGGLEKINKDEIISLRLFALSNSSNITSWWSFIFVYLQDFVYIVLKGIAYIISIVLNVIIYVKNIDLLSIAEAVKLDELGKLINNILIYNKDSNGNVFFSPLVILSMCMLIATIVKYAIQYYKGKTNLKEVLKDVLLIGILGAVLISASMNGITFKVGNSISKITNLVLTNNLASTQETGIFVTRTEGKDANSNMDLATNQISQVNKIIIDAQICKQFGVSEVSTLNFNNLGDTNGEIANRVLGSYFGVPLDEGFLDRIANNLGYYYWFANSYADNIQNRDEITLPRRTNLVQSKLSNIVTYLQVLLNNAIENNNVEAKKNIISIFSAFMKPSSESGLLSMFMLIALFMCIVAALYKYVIKIIFAKMEFIVGILAVPVAGILILTTNEKSVNTGKGILGITLISFIKIVVYSLFFDVIIQTVSILGTTDPIKLFIICALLVLMIKYNGAIEKFITTILNKLERKYALQGSMLKAGIKKGISEKLDKANKKVNERIKERDSNFKLTGDEESEEFDDYLEASKGDMTKRKLLGIASSLMKNQNVSNVYKSIKAEDKIREKDIRSTKSRFDNARMDKAEKDYEDALRTVENIKLEIENEIDLEYSKIYNSESGKFDESRLTEEEKEYRLNAEKYTLEKEEIYNNKSFRKLRARVAKGEELKGKDLERYNEFNEKLEEKLKLADQSENKITSSIKERLRDKVYNDRKDEYTEANNKALEAKKKKISTSLEVTTDTKIKVTNKDFAAAASIEHVLDNSDNSDIKQVERDAKRKTKDLANKAFEDYKVQKEKHDAENSIEEKNPHLDKDKQEMKERKQIRQEARERRLENTSSNSSKNEDEKHTIKFGVMLDDDSTENSTIDNINSNSSNERKSSTNTKETDTKEARQSTSDTNRDNKIDRKSDNKEELFNNKREERKQEDRPKRKTNAERRTERERKNEEARKALLNKQSETIIEETESNIPNNLDELDIKTGVKSSLDMTDDEIMKEALDVMKEDEENIE